MNRLEDTGEHLLRLGAAGGTIAAAHFSGDDRGPERVFGAPVRGVDGIRVEQEREHRRKLDREMGSEIARDATGARAIDEGVELIVQMATGDRQPMSRYLAAPKAIARGERALQDALDVRREMVLAVIGDQRATPPEQMGQTGLMNRVIEAAIGRPPVAHQRPGEVGAEDRGGLLEAAARQNGVHGRVGCGERPEPLQLAADFPARFIGTDDGTVTDLRSQRVVGGTRAIGGAVQRVDEAARRDVEAKAVAKQGADFGEWQAQLRVQHRRERDRLRPKLRRGRAQRIGRLQRMPALHAATTGAAATNLDRKRAHDRLDDRQVFLVLLRAAGAAEPSTTMRARLRQACAIPFVNMRGERTVGFAAVRTTRSPAGSSRMTCRSAARERRRLAVHLATRVVELIFEPVDLLAKCVPLLPIAIPVLIRSLVLAPQPIDLALAPLELGDQGLALALLPLQLGDQVIARCGPPACQHAPVMPRLLTAYKKKRVCAARRRPPLRSVTR